MSWLPPSDGRLPITDTVALSYEIGWLRHRRIFKRLPGAVIAYHALPHIAEHIRKIVSIFTRILLIRLKMGVKCLICNMK